MFITILSNYYNINNNINCDGNNNDNKTSVIKL